MNALFPFGPFRVAADLIAAVASRDECAILVGEADATAAVLDRVGRELPGRRVRCVRVTTPPAGALVLSGLVAQVAGRSDAGALTDADLEAGFLALTDPGEGYDRVALLVEGAQALSPPALRYLQLVCRSGPRLRLVFAGAPGLDAVLAGGEFARLRRLFTCRLDLSDPASAGLPPPFPTMPFPATPVAPGWDAPPEVPARRRAASRSWIELALVASLALAVWATWQEDTPAPSQTAARVHVPVEGETKEALALQAAWQDKSAPVRPKAAEVDDAPGRAGHAFAQRARVEEPPPLAPEAAVLSVGDARTDADAAPPRRAETPAAPGAEPSASIPRRDPVPAGATVGGPGVKAPAHSVAPPPPEATVVAALPASVPVTPTVVTAPPAAVHAVPGGTERMADVLVAATAPVGGADERRCRDAVLRVLSGQAPSDADKRFLRGGCHAE